MRLPPDGHEDQAAAMSVCRNLYVTLGDAVRDDEPISGADMVEYILYLWPLIERAVGAERTT